MADRERERDRQTGKYRQRQRQRHRERNREKIDRDRTISGIVARREVTHPHQTRGPEITIRPTATSSLNIVETQSRWKYNPTLTFHTPLHFSRYTLRTPHITPTHCLASQRVTLRTRYCATRVSCWGVNLSDNCSMGCQILALRRHGREE